MNIEKEKRQEAILLSLKRLDYLDREQIQKLHNLGKVRNTQRVLSNMSECISSFTHDRKNIYYLNKDGRERVGATKVRKKTAMINHFLMRNDLYIALGRPSSWKNEMKIAIPNTKISIVSDSIYIANKVHHFVEVDFKQSMIKNTAKIKRYRQLSEFNPNFVLIWITTTPYKKKKLQSLCEGLNVQVYLWDDIK
ncbi:replication-relaxation family protein [Metabacillus sp. BG109]|uniref:Replication-relaxation family protein n=1 Tax=Metabacillus bambusae TaxID=2795218 RepID=A0ABS3NBC1_9BACI|nr:replication-relaxation family protein [Metabacillus bambusae]MBO1515508.1 replication-relaxation family protein [Metabacillus bambusae]